MLHPLTTLLSRLTSNPDNFGISGKLMPERYLVSLMRSLEGVECKNHVDVISKALHMYYQQQATSGITSTD